MNNDYEIKLHSAVELFKKVANEKFPQITEDNDNGEWCDELDEFFEMIAASISVVKNLSVFETSEQTKDHLLYAIARDCECSNIIYEVLEYDDWFTVLCEKSIHTNYINAKRQFAQLLGEYEGNDSTKEFVFDFLSSGDEYTERMALKSLAKIYPEKAEKYAIEFWERQKFPYDEYQKMMAIYVLYQIKSSRLQYYLRKSEESSYEHLRNSGKEIRLKLEDTDQ